MKLKNDGADTSALKELSETIEYDNVDEKWEPKVYVFTSIDLVNSTIFKKECQSWPIIFKGFFDIVKCEFETRKLEAELWKTAGDEILFHEEITDISSLLRYPSDIFLLMSICQNNLWKNWSETSNKLYLKATVWCALVKDENDENQDIGNIITSNYTASFDFFGEDIDQGFRLSKYTSQTKLIVDAKLAYLMNSNENIINTECDYIVKERVKIVGYRKLKGIWDNRIYPIIWYHKEWSSPEKMYLYDEFETNSIVQDLKQNEYATEDLDTINKIIDELGLCDSCERIVETLNNAKSQNKLSKHNNSNLLEIHFATVCIRTDKKEALIVKRAVGRELLPSLWEFGCAKGNKNWSIGRSIKDEYKDDFGIDIDVIVDEKTKENDPIPITTYEIKKNRKFYKGIIFVAKIISEPDKIALDEKKHCEFKWIGESDIDTFDEDITVPNFKLTLRKAFKLFIEDSDD